MSYNDNNHNYLDLDDAAVDDLFGGFIGNENSSLFSHGNDYDNDVMDTIVEPSDEPTALFDPYFCEFGMSAIEEEMLYSPFVPVCMLPPEIQEASAKSVPNNEVYIETIEKKHADVGRKFRTRKERRFQRRPTQQTDYERKRENALNSKAYTERNNDELNSYKLTVPVLKKECDGLRMEIDNLCRHDNRESEKAKEAMNVAEAIKAFVDRYTKNDWALLEVSYHRANKEIYQYERDVNDLQGSLNNPVTIKPEVEKSYQELKWKTEKLEKEDTAGMTKKEKGNHASNKSRTKKRFLIASNKREYFQLEQKIEIYKSAIKAIEEASLKLRLNIWKSYLAHIDVPFTCCENYADGVTFSRWNGVRQTYGFICSL